MALRDAPPDLGEDRSGAPAPRSTPDERDDTEVAREAAAVLDLDEGADAIKPGVRADTADRAHVAGHEGGGLLARPRHDRDVGRHPGERLTRQVGAAARDVDARVGDAARIDDRDPGRVGSLGVTVGEQPFADLLGVRLRDLAAEEPNRDARHGAGWYSRR